MDHVVAKRRQISDSLEDLERLAQQGGLLVGQVMTGRPSWIKPETPVVDLIDLFHVKQFRHLLVLDDGNELIGIISDRDVLRCLGPEKTADPAELEGVCARDIMSTDLITVTPGTSLDRAVTLMTDHGVSCLPVQIDSTLVGILTNTDLNLVLQGLLKAVCWSSSSESIKPVPTGPHH